MSSRAASRAYVYRRSYDAASFQTVHCDLCAAPLAGRELVASSLASGPHCVAAREKSLDDAGPDRAFRLRVLTVDVELATIAQRLVALPLDGHGFRHQDIREGMTESSGTGDQQTAHDILVVTHH